MASFACRALSMPQIRSGRISSQVASIGQRRGLASAADGTPKVNFWQEPTNPANWKEEHFVLISLAGWGLVGYGGYKFFTRGKGKQEAKPVDATQ